MAKTTDIIQARTQALYDAVDPWMKDDICEVAPWAKRVLTNYEGSGHSLYVHGENDRFVSCSFSKVAWASDFTGSPMGDGAEAIVMAVCEYLAWQGIDSWSGLND